MNDFATALTERRTIALVPIMATVLVGFLVIGIALPVLPLHVHLGLGQSTFVVGLITGSQFAASLLSRVWAGNFADAKGAKQTVLTGLGVATVAGGLYFLSLLFQRSPGTAVSVLLLGRATLGIAESLIITGAVSWGLGLAGQERAGQVIAWMGMAMFGAFAVGGPLGSHLYALNGFPGIALATMLVPLLTLVLTTQVRGVPPLHRKSKPNVCRVLSAVWLPGVASALSSVGFGAVLSFSSLLTAQQHWSPLWLLFTAFALALVGARAVLGHLPDRRGGARVALVSLVIQATGLVCIWRANGLPLAVLGAALTGSGYALVYPGLGSEAVRRTPPENKGLAMSAYTIFLDIALGVGTPALGLVGGAWGLSSVYLVSALASVLAIALVIQLKRNSTIGR